MIPLLINQSNISLDFSLQLSKSLEDSDLAVIGLKICYCMTQNQLICLNDGQATRRNSNSIIDLALTT
jgi:hypothetical protein